MELLERDRIDFVFDRRQRVTCDTRRVGRLEMTFRIPSRLCGEDKPVRYWFDGVDEGFERETERRRKLGLLPPTSDPTVTRALAWFLVAGEIFLWLALAVVICRILS